MEYDHGTQNASYGRSSSGAYPSPGQSSSLYPKIGGASTHKASSFGGPPGRNPPYHNAPTPSSSGMGIRVALKPEYRITAPPVLLPQLGEIPRSNFHFDFEFEKIVMNEAVKENPNWSRLLENVPPPKPIGHVSSHNPSVDPLVSKFIGMGLNREAVPLAVANFGDNPAKVKEFANGFTLLQEMGFAANNVAEALLMFDNDTNKALAHFLRNTS